MSFIEEHVGSLPRASVGVAVGEAFGFLRDGGAYTIRLVMYCGIILVLFGLAQDYFGAKGIWFSIVQTMAESLFVYSWHRFALLGEQQIGGDYWSAFVKRTLFYYFILVVTIIMGTLVFLTAAGGLSDAMTIFMLLAFAVLFYIFGPRIALVFPAIAVNSPTIKMRDAFVLSSGNVWALAGAYLVMTFVVLLLFSPIIAVSYFAEAQIGVGAESPFYILGINVLIGFPVAVSTLLWAGLNSSLYRQLGGDIPSPQRGETETQAAEDSVA